MDKITQVDIDSVKPYENNPRQIEKAVAVIKESIARYGFIDPIYVDRNMVIVVGHARHQAAKELGMAKIDIVIWDIDEKTAKPYRIVDNKIHEYSIWNDDLWQELKEFKNLDLVKKLFPEFNSMVNNNQSSFEPINQDDVDKQENKNRVKFTEFTSHHQSQLLSITCPSCGGQFNLKKVDVINDIKYKGGA